MPELAALAVRDHLGLHPGDRKSTRLNSSHTVISYAVFCLIKKNRIGVVARMRSPDLAAADVIRRARRALAGVSGPLLLVRLLAAAAHVGPGLGRVRSRALRCLLRLDQLPQKVVFDLGAEDCVGESELAVFFPFAATAVIYTLSLHDALPI